MSQETAGFEMCKYPRVGSLGGSRHGHELLLPLRNHTNRPRARFFYDYLVQILSSEEKLYYRNVEPLSSIQVFISKEASRFRDLLLLTVPCTKSICSISKFQIKFCCSTENLHLSI